MLFLHDSDRELSTVFTDLFQDALKLLAILLHHFHVLANVVAILLNNLERLTNTCRAYFQLVIAQLVTQRLLQVAAQVGTVLNPYTVGMIDFNHDTVVSGHFYIYEVIVTLLQPLLNSFCHYVFVNHKRYLSIKKQNERLSLESLIPLNGCKGTKKKGKERVKSEKFASAVCFFCIFSPFYSSFKAHDFSQTPLFSIYLTASDVRG